MSEVASVYIDTKQAAALVGLKPATLEKMRVVGHGPRFYRPTRRVLYKRADLETWMESHARSNTSEQAA